MLAEIKPPIDIFKPLKEEKPNFTRKTHYFWIARNFDLKKRKPVQWALKRISDVSVSLIGLIALIPVFIVIALVIKLESKGPVFYKNHRTGLHGREFYLYKFRSMYQNAESLEDEVRRQNNEEDNVMYKIENDPRITRVGKFLRKYSIDELPQLINVIKGEMSLVGPRARASRDLIYYKNWHYLFFATLPGITGMWQTSGRSSLKDFDKVVMLEYKYILNWSLFFDLYLALKTIPVVIFGKDTA